MLQTPDIANIAAAITHAFAIARLLLLDTITYYLLPQLFLITVTISTPIPTPTPTPAAVPIPTLPTLHVRVLLSQI